MISLPHIRESVQFIAETTEGNSYVRNTSFIYESMQIKSSWRLETLKSISNTLIKKMCYKLKELNVHYSWLLCPLILKARVPYQYAKSLLCICEHSRRLVHKKTKKTKITLPSDKCNYIPKEMRQSKQLDVNLFLQRDEMEQAAWRQFVLANFLTMFILEQKFPDSFCDSIRFSVCTQNMRPVQKIPI